MPTAEYINADSCWDKDEWVTWYKRLLAIIDFFRYEKCDRFFDLKNLVQATYPFNFLKDYYEERDEFPGITENVLAQIGSMGFVDWREESAIDGHHYFFYDFDVTNDTLGEVARAVLSEKSVVLLNMGAITCPSPIKLSYAHNHCSIKIYHVDSIQTLHEWFSKNRKPQRIFVYSSKHGDFFKPSQIISGTGRKAAQLECLQDEAQSLLNHAIGNDIESSLWFYDDKYNKHIYFENQNERRLAFHGYHLNENEENFANISKVKLSVILGKNYDNHH